MLSPGQRLRSLREQLGLTIREVEAASIRLSQKYGNQEFVLSLSRLSDIETKGVLPSIYRLYSFSIIYRRDIKEILSWYGIDLAQWARDLEMVAVPKTHKLELLPDSSSVRVPLAMDPAFDLRRTANIGRMIQKWGTVPFSFLAKLAEDDYTYGYIGTEDFTMYPLLLPGSFVQIDETDIQIKNEGWRSEYERPVYFVETRSGYTCCWCSISGDSIILQAHPLSPVPSRVLRYPQEAEVIGQVVGVAIRLGDWKPLESSPAPKERAALN